MRYLDELDRVLEDRVLDECESDTLNELAKRDGLSADDRSELHHAYFSSILTEYSRDDQITDDESRDLNRISHLLGIDKEQIEESDGNIRETLESMMDVTIAGSSVCFTGSTSCVFQGKKITKSDATSLAEEAELVVEKNVTKKLDILVVADPDSQSGKAKKARHLGIRIIRDRTFWRKLGLQVD